MPQAYQDPCLPFKTPSKDHDFRFVCSTQVLEHVQDLEAIAAELARITAPGGRQVHFFPVLETLWEGHANVPLLHRLPSGRLRQTWGRLCYLAVPVHSVGNGAARPSEWSRDFDEYLERFTAYRRLASIESCLGRYFDVRRLCAESLLFSLDHKRGHAARLIAHAARRAPRAAVNWAQLRRRGVCLELRRR